MIRFMVCLYNNEQAGAKAAARPGPWPAEEGSGEGTQESSVLAGLPP